MKDIGFYRRFKLAVLNGKHVGNNRTALPSKHLEWFNSHSFDEPGMDESIRKMVNILNEQRGLLA